MQQLTRRLANMLITLGLLCAGRIWSERGGGRGPVRFPLPPKAVMLIAGERDGKVKLREAAAQKIFCEHLGRQGA